MAKSKTVAKKPAAPARRGSFTIVANWKENLGDGNAAKVASQVAAACAKINGAPAVILCPPFTALRDVAESVAGTSLTIGSQDVSSRGEGAHTGEVSAGMIRAAGCSYAIVGHSERRHELGETDEIVNAKLSHAVAAGLTPILCVGETWDERSDSKSEAVVMRQLQSALAGITLAAGRKLLVAYEPVWAIGSNNPVEPNEAAHVAHLIRHVAVDGDHFGFSCPNPDQQVSVLYGGSVNAENVASFVLPGVIGGALVGGASLSVANFVALVRRVAG